MVTRMMTQKKMGVLKRIWNLILTIFGHLTLCHEVEILYIKGTYGVELKDALSKAV